MPAKGPANVSAKAPVIVIDASSLAALLFGEPEAEDVARRTDGATLIAPTLLPFEIASVTLKKLRKYPDQREQILAAYRLLDRMAIDLIDEPLEQVVLLAEKKGLTSYDAAYVWLAISCGAELETLDRDVAKAMGK